MASRAGFDSQTRPTFQNSRRKKKMCLDEKLAKREFFRKNKSSIKFKNGKIIAWKVVSRGKNGKLHPVSFNKCSSFSVRKWNLDEKKPKGERTIICPDNTHYKTGYHVLLNMNHARMFITTYGLGSRNTKIIKVYISEIVAQGLQSHLPVIVGRAMFIPKQFALTRNGNVSKYKIE
jgi:hypothetical protein